MGYDNRITVDSLLKENKLLRLQIDNLIGIVIKLAEELKVEKDKNNVTKKA